MSIERTYYCDADGCERHGTTAAPNRPAFSFIKVTQEGSVKHFCGWDCVMKYAASFPPKETIPWYDKEGQ